MPMKSCCVFPRRSGGAFLSSALIEARMTRTISRWCDGRCRLNSREYSEHESMLAASRGLLRSNVSRRCSIAGLDANAISVASAKISAAREIYASSGRLQMRNNLLRHTPFIVELRNIPFRQQEQILFYIADRLPRFVGGAMDARGNGQYLAESAMQRYGSAYPAGDAFGGLVSREYAALQSGFRRRQYRAAARRRNSCGPPLTRDGKWHCACAGAACARHHGQAASRRQRDRRCARLLRQQAEPD